MWIVKKVLNRRILCDEVLRYVNLYTKADTLEEIAAALGLAPNIFNVHRMTSGIYVGESINDTDAGKKLFTELRTTLFRLLVVHGYTGTRLSALASIGKRSNNGRGYNGLSTGKQLIDYKAFSNNSIRRIENRIWSTRDVGIARHNIVLSFENILEAIGIVGVTCSVGKLAMVAYSIRIGYSPKSYRDARECVIAYINRGKLTNTSGILRFGEKFLYKKGNIYVYSVYTIIPMYVKGKTLKSTERVFMVKHIVYGTYYSTLEENIIKEAVVEFRRRRKCNSVDDIILKAVDKDSGVLCHIQDSFDVNNCVDGTYAWANAVGMYGMKVVPLYRLYEAAVDSGEVLAMNVVRKIANELV
jgi:hypothetical protein